MTNDRRGAGNQEDRPAPIGSAVRLQSGKGELVVLETRDGLMQAAAELFVSAAEWAIEQSGRFTVALSGGSTPRAMYSLLATPAYATCVEWSRVHVFWTDERCVPPDDQASNYRMAREALLDRVPVADTNVHRIAGEDEPDAAARTYESELRALFHTPAGPPRPATGDRFDLILLGMGEDGHTASIFPGSAAVRETHRWVVAEPGTAARVARVTLTPPLINAAATILFLVAGRKKAGILQRVLEGPYDPDAVPAQIVAPRAGRLQWLTDADAAADLTITAGT